MLSSFSPLLPLYKLLSESRKGSAVSRNVILRGLPGAHSMLLCAEGAEREGLGECYGASESTESTERSDREWARIGRL